MTYQRRKLASNPLITPETVEAWRRRDFRQVAELLRLKPWECSPVWCRERWFGDAPPCREHAQSGCLRAVELRDELNAAIGYTQTMDNDE